MNADLPHVVIHTDGACSGNPGPGGWGAILSFGDREKELKGGEPNTTNNRMELMAAISALEALKRPCRVDLHTDSQYLRNGIMSWIGNWKRNGWRTADKKPVKNVDLWQRLDAALGPHQIHWHWVQGSLRPRYERTRRRACARGHRRDPRGRGRSGASPAVQQFSQSMSQSVRELRRPRLSIRAAGICPRPGMTVTSTSADFPRRKFRLCRALPRH